jgi:hypothetical protein
MRVPNLEPIYIHPPSRIYGQPVVRPEHKTDIIRLEVLIRLGGIYLDLDVVALQSWDPLLKYLCTMGAESPNLLSNGIILAARNATFLRLLHGQYRTFDDTSWNGHSVQLPMLLARQYTHLVHIEWHQLQRPNWNERQWIYR